jgi:MFS family permease
VTLTLGLVPLLIGFTVAETAGFGDPYFWGWIAASVVFLAIFVFIERRSPEPVIPLRLFRNRTFSASMLAIFFATFGFGAVIIFLPLYFLIVQGVSYTQSGYQLLPFMFGLILASISSGQIVARTGRYKPVILVGLVLLIIGMGLMTQLRADTPSITLASWMFVAGLGVGPTFAVFTIIVQNAVDFRDLGAATSDLTLFRQIGTTVGIAAAFSLFRLNFTWDLLKDQVATALNAGGIPPAVYSQFLTATPPAGFDPGAVTNVSGNGATDFLALIPAQIQPLVVDGFHRALTIAIGNSIWLGVAASAIALLAAFGLKEIPLRRTQQSSAAQHAAASDAARSAGTRPVIGVD